LHPLAPLFVLPVSFEVAGILGGLFAVPVAAIRPECERLGPTVLCIRGSRQPGAATMNWSH
jgi:hypothetical protein